MAKLIAFVLLALACTSFVSARQATCKALVLEAGADLGGYEAGVVKGLIDAYQALGRIEEVEWDVFVGVSVGSINAAAYGQFSKEETLQMADWVVGLWKSIKKTDVYSNYLGGIVQGLLFEESLFKTDPLRQFLTSKLTQKQKRLLSIGATNANTGEFERFNETLSVPDIVSALMCSSAVPAFFPYQVFRGNTYFDGGVLQSTDIYGAIERCLEIVDDPSQIIIDVVLITNKHLNQDVPTVLHPLKVSTLANNIRQYLTSRRALVEGQDFYPDVNWRFIINPEKKLPSSEFPLTFNAAQIEEMINTGIQDGLDAVAEHEASLLSKSGDIDIDTFSVSAKRAFIEAYEALFANYDIAVDQHKSA